MKALAESGGRWLLVVAVLLSTACVPQLTPRQVWTIDAAEACRYSGGGQLTKVWPDGQAEVSGLSPHMMINCMREYEKTHPYPPLTEPSPK